MAGGRPGPAPTPTKVVQLFGNPGKRARPPEVEPRDASLDPPKDLTPLAKQFWTEHVGEVARLGMLTVNDVPTFAALAEAWAFMQQSKKAMQPRRGANAKATPGASGTRRRAPGRSS